MPALTRPHGEARDDYAIFAGLAERLGAGKDFTEGRTAMDWLRHLYDEWRGKLAERGRAVPGFDEFWASDGLELPVASESQVAFADFRADPEGHPLTTPTGKIEIFSETIDSYRYPDCPGHPVWREPDEWLGSPAAQRFRLQLVANQPRSRLHSQVDVGAHSQSLKIAGREPVRLHPADAAARGLRDGDLVRIFNDRGACLAGLAVDEAVRPGVAQLFHRRLVRPGPGQPGLLPSRQPQRAHRRPHLLHPQPGLHRPAGPRRDRAVPRHPAGALGHPAARDRLKPPLQAGCPAAGAVPCHRKRTGPA